jgi:hypothetical protein
MKTMLIFTTSAIFILGTSFAREESVSPVVIPHQEVIVERHASQSISSAHASGALCWTKDITTTSSDGDKTTRKSVDCEE